MRILFDMGHPAHVHCGDPVAATPTLVGGIFKNAIWELEKRGHAVCRLNIRLPFLVFT